MGFLSFDELPEKERPPERIWLNHKKMKAWWDEVKRIREAEMKGEDQSGMAKNKLTDQLLKGF